MVRCEQGGKKLGDGVWRRKRLGIMKINAGWIGGDEKRKGDAR